MVGALLGLVGNLLHPGTPNDPQGIARVIAGSGMWVSVHTTIMVLFVLMLAGLVAIAHSISGGGAGCWHGWVWSPRWRASLRGWG